MFERGLEPVTGLPSAFFKELMGLGETVTFKSNQIIFKEGDEAEYFFILINGKVDISVGEIGHTVYTVTHPGEVFGWSCVLGRTNYSATAECKEDSKVAKIKGEEVIQFLERDPHKGIVFYRSVAKILVNRLLQLYKLISEISGPESGITYGTGQITGSKEE